MLKITVKKPRARRNTNRPTRKQERLIRRIRRLYDDGKIDPVQKRHMIGRLVDDYVGGRKKCDEADVAAIATELQLSPNTMLRWRSVAKAFSDDYIERLVARTARTSRGITWTHLVTIAPFPVASLRQRLIDDVFEQSLTATELRKRVRQPFPCGLPTACVA